MMTPASALLALLHQSSVKYLDLAIRGDTISAQMTVAPSDLTEPLGLPPDAQPTPAAAGTPAAGRYTRDWVVITGCTAGDASAGPDLEGRFVAVRWELHCRGNPDELDLDLSRFFSVDSRHEAIVRVVGQGPIVVRSTSPRWVIPVGDDPPPCRWWLAIPGIAGVAMVGVVRSRRRRPRM